MLNSLFPSALFFQSCLENCVWSTWLNFVSTLCGVSCGFKSLCVFFFPLFVLPKHMYLLIQEKRQQGVAAWRWAELDPKQASFQGLQGFKLSFLFATLSPLLLLLCHVCIVLHVHTNNSQRINRDSRNVPAPPGTLDNVEGNVKDMKAGWANATASDLQNFRFSNPGISLSPVFFPL